LTVGSQRFKEGDALSIDGTAGEVYAGAITTGASEVIAGLLANDAEAKKGRTFKNFVQLMKWCGEATRMSVRTNADTPEQVRNALAFGAVGIGLTRTEHMFFEGDRIDAMREMILAESLEAREAALAKLLPYQREDFFGIFRELKGYPATIRFLDPPLHEFLPHTEEDVAELALKIGVSADKLRHKRDSLHEVNPMLGHRGCRLGITFPEIYRMQVRAIAQAAQQVANEGVRVRPEIMIPLVSHPEELARLRALVLQEVASLRRDTGKRLALQVGTMIEVPRAALTADAIAAHADFFSFGTNDLTQMGYALSRDDAGSFLPEYIEAGILSEDPFVSIDEQGIGLLLGIASRKGRAVRPDLKLGLCGEHGGDPQSVRFCHRIGLDYVSCSPFRVPIARLAAAQAAVESA
jgi:pyruvate,orthophosphate dikinase